MGYLMQRIRKVGAFFDGVVKAEANRSCEVETPLVFQHGNFHKVPGNFSGKWGNVTFYFPLGICIALSIILSLLSWVFKR